MSEIFCCVEGDLTRQLSNAKLENDTIFVSQLCKVVSFLIAVFVWKRKQHYVLLIGHLLNQIRIELVEENYKNETYDVASLCMWVLN